MLKITKTEELAARNIPFGVVEVRYPPREEWRVDEFRAFAQGELERARESYPDYERKAVFGSDPYVRFFKKFKKTYTVMLQFESIIIKRLPFPAVRPCDRDTLSAGADDLYALRYARHRPHQRPSGAVFRHGQDALRRYARTRMSHLSRRLRRQGRSGYNLQRDRRSR